MNCSIRTIYAKRDPKNTKNDDMIIYALEKGSLCYFFSDLAFSVIVSLAFPKVRCLTQKFSYFSCEFFYLLSPINITFFNFLSPYISLEMPTLFCVLIFRFYCFFLNIMCYLFYICFSILLFIIIHPFCSFCFLVFFLYLFFYLFCLYFLF